MVRLCGGGGRGRRSAISRLARFVGRRWCSSAQHHHHGAGVDPTSTGGGGCCFSACRWWTRPGSSVRCRLSRIAMPTGAAASLLLLLTIMSQSQAPQQSGNLGDFHPGRLPTLGKSGQLPPEVITYRHYDELLRKAEKSEDVWDHKISIRRIASKNNTQKEKTTEKSEGKLFKVIVFHFISVF